MAICGACGAETARIRSRWDKGIQLPDECISCAPESFEKFMDPSTKKLWTGPEFAPNEYERLSTGELRLKPEFSHELEEKCSGAKSVTAQEERDAEARAVAEKRATRRTHPMSEAEHRHAIAMVDRLFRPLIEDKNTAYDA